MAIELLNIQGNPTIGILGFANNEICLVSRNVTKKEAAKISEALEVPVEHISLCGTSLIGVFAAGDDEHIIVPNIVLKNELEQLQNLKINIHAIDTTLTALGNNVIIGPKGIICNPEFDDQFVGQLETIYNRPVVQMTIAGVETVGSVVAVNTSGAVVHRDASPKEQKVIEETLGVPVHLGTVCLGSPYIRSGVVHNDKGIIIGDTTGGPEIQTLDEGLGYINT